jgi:hypothetical protein
MLTARYIGDPEQFWRVCDANRALLPDDLTAAAGNVIRITLPEACPLRASSRPRRCSRGSTSR